MRKKVTDKKPISKKKATEQKGKVVLPSPMSDLFIDGNIDKAEAEGESVPMEVRSLEVKEGSDQVTPGLLIQIDQASPFQTIDERFDEIEIGEIEHFSGLPDFVAPSRSKFPFVIQTPVSRVCIDGWDRIEKARAEGATHITCHVEEIAEHSEEELALRKAAIRVVARGGRGSYGERVRNTKILEEILLNSDDDLKSFDHGGDRRGQDYLSNNEENVRKILASRLELSPPAINKILAHASFLDGETLNFLASEGAKKDFFEQAQRKKTPIVKMMKGDHKSKTDITIHISHNVKEWYKGYARDKKITTVWNVEEPTRENRSHDLIEIPASKNMVPTEARRVVLDPWPGNADENEEDSFQQLKDEVEGCAERLLEIANLTDIEEFQGCLTEEIRNLLEIDQAIDSLRNAARESDFYDVVPE